jgi:hypothetical protein
MFKLEVLVCEHSFNDGSVRTEEKREDLPANFSP